ncbi:thioredoxin family protein [Rhodohalobacter sp. SW132]|uniref:thioredoxin family protein n=1 Tax=Rhodohalobacter sp. SW132 TaxID=2293433 RepID=UPI000E269F23|nr:thioredoxin family protein [Rhodohalobacter sp. SW132]REL32961.1 thioredoxin family protein [Rhodohalobacter sp. SW132]
MKKITFLSVLLIAIASLAFLNMGMASESNLSGAVVGEPAPDFSVVDAYGNTHSLSDYEGQFVILEWLNHDCPFVRKHYDGNNMQELQKKYTDQDVVWLSVISSAPGTQGYLEPEGAQKITGEKNASPTAVLLDEDGTMGRAYDARVTPHMYIINPDGILEYNGAIDDRPTPRARDLEGARNYVVEAMDALMNGGEIEVRTNTPYGCTVKYN